MVTIITVYPHFWKFKQAEGVCPYRRLYFGPIIYRETLSKCTEQVIFSTLLTGYEAMPEVSSPSFTIAAGQQWVEASFHARHLKDSANKQKKRRERQWKTISKRRSSVVSVKRWWDDGGMQAGKRWKDAARRAENNKNINKQWHPKPVCDWLWMVFFFFFFFVDKP